jgi:predicted CxxxxCH...CXXCH cytochrome family protein
MTVHASWTLNTWVKSGGGTIIVRGGTPQTSANGSVFKTYTTSQSFAVTVNPTTGYTINQVNYNNVVTNSPSQTSYTVHGLSSQNVFATFAPQPITVKASVSVGSIGGSVTPTSLSGIYYGTKLTSAKTFTFRPSPSTSNVSSISGVPAGASVTSSLPAAANTPVTVTLPIGFTFTSNIDLVGSFSGPPVAKVGPPQTVMPGTPTTLDGSSSTGLPTSYSWTQTSGPGYPATKVITDNTSGALVTFTPSVIGTYTFTLTVTGGSTAITTVTVTNELAGVVRTQCINCHTANGIGVARNVFGNWSASLHKTNGVICSQCHIGTNTGGHPGQLTSGSVRDSTFNYNAGYGSGNFCVTCHKPAIITEFAASPHFVRAGTASCSFCHVQGVHNPNAKCVDCHNASNSLGLSWPPAGWDFHNDYTGTILCLNCHNLHNPSVVTGMSGAAHYNNITSAGYPASYVTSKAVCENCHTGNTTTNATVRHQWAKSRHAAFTDPAWTIDDFKTKSGCVQCHTTTGFIAYSTGKVTAAWGVASDKTKELITCVACHKDVAGGIVRTVTPVKPFAADNYVNRNVGISNICMDCHSGRNNGLSITSADFTNQAFIAPHYLAAGGILHGKGGYNSFPGQTYAFYSSNSHRAIGMGNTNNTGTDGPCIACHMSAPQKHRFNAVSSTTSGIISQITTTTCSNCHASYLGATEITSKKNDYSNALDVLKAMLAAKGFVYSPSYPYFANKNWGSGQVGADTMGAAFNYLLLLKEPGAYAHNSAYAKQLIFDSIDYLHNGMITNSIDSALTYLVNQQWIIAGQASSLTTYKNSGSCNSCHGYPPAIIKHNGAAHPNNTNCSTCHNTDPSVHINGIVDVSTNCNACHGNPPDYANGTPKANSHGSPSHKVACNICHAGTTTTGTTISNTTLHMNGTYDLLAGSGVSFTYVYGANGGTCSNISCHGNTAATWGSAAACNVCHGNPPPNMAGNYTGVDEATSPHMKHAGSGSNYSFACSECHKGNSHATGTFQDVFIDKNGILAGTNATYNNATRTCSAFYCHSDGTSVVTGLSENPSVGWGANKLSCSGCHGYPPNYASTPQKTNSHSKHNFNCGICHTGTTVDGLTIANKSLHVNKAYDVSPGQGFSFTYLGGGNCNNISCHANNSATWGGPTVGGCSTCHGYPPPNTAVGYSAVTESTSPHMKHAGNGSNYNFSCSECHKGNTHGNGTFQDVFKNTSGVIAGSAAKYTASSKTCSALFCHSDGTSLSNEQPITAGVVWGSNKLACDGCHGFPPNYEGGTVKANNHGNHSDYGCSTCHAGTTLDDSTINNKALHANGAYNLTPGNEEIFNYTYAKDGGTCTNISCHQGANATWGRNINHTITTDPEIRIENSIILTDSAASDHSDNVWVSTNCELCHSSNIIAQHNNDCAVCHMRVTPTESHGQGLVDNWTNALDGWDGTCQACHVKKGHRPDHSSKIDISDCTQCHTGNTPDPNNANNCISCHDQGGALTVDRYKEIHPPKVYDDTSPFAVKGDLKLLVHMDESSWNNGTANQVKDSSGWNSNGTSYNATTVAGGISGRAGSFDASQVSTVTMKYPSDSPPADTFTLEAWVKPAGTHAIDIESDSGNGASYNFLKFPFYPDYGYVNDVGAGVSVGTNGISVYEHGNIHFSALAVYQGTISSSEWTHIAIVYNNKRPSIYVNGVLVRTGMQSSANHVYAPHIFGGSGEVWGFYTGLLDEVAVYDTALTGTEILQRSRQNQCTTVSNSTITIRWTTASASTSYVDYGLTSDYGTTTGDGLLYNSHAVGLSGLTDNSTYHYRVRSTNFNGEEFVSEDYTFTTGSSCDP